MQKCTVFTIMHCDIIQNSRFNIVAKFEKQVGVSGATLLVELVYHPNWGGGCIVPVKFKPSSDLCFWLL